jgi:hypothetical protein
MYTRNRAHVDGDAFCVIETGDFLITWSKLHSLLSTDLLDLLDENQPWSKKKKPRVLFNAS